MLMHLFSASAPVISRELVKPLSIAVVSIAAFALVAAFLVTSHKRQQLHSFAHRR